MPLVTIPADAHSQVGHRLAGRVVGFVFVTVFLDLVGFGIVIPLLPFYVQSMGGSARTVGVLLSCFSLTQLVATPFLGRLSDRYGRRRVILISLLGNAISMVLFALATKLHLLALLFGSRILAGATAGNLSACQAAIADVTEGPSRAKGMGRLGAGIGLGMVLGPAIGSALSQLGEWAPPLGAAAMAMLDLLGAFFFMPETRRAPTAETMNAAASAPRAPMMTIVTERRIVIVLALFFLTFLAMTNLQVSLAFLTEHRFGWGQKEVGYIFTLWGVVMLIVQGLLIGRIAKKFQSTSIVIAGSTLLALGLAIIAVAERRTLMIAGLTSMGVGLGLIQPMLATLASEYAPSAQRGAVLGVAQSSGGLARTIGPTLSGYLYVLRPSAPFLSGALSAFVALVLATILRGERRAPQAAADAARAAQKPG